MEELQYEATNLTYGKAVCKTAEAKTQRDFLLRLTQEQRLEPKVSSIAGQCAGCGRDVYQWELAQGYAAFDGFLYCGGCLRQFQLR